MTFWNGIDQSWQLEAPAKEARLTGAKSSPFSMVTLLTSVSALVDCSCRFSLLATIWARLTAAEAMGSQRQRQRLIDSLVNMMAGV